MRKAIGCLTALLVCGVLACAQNPQTFKGTISDSGCGSNHMITGDTAAVCTRECVEMGARFVLAVSGDKIYALSDQEKARSFAGQSVVVTGTLKGAVIQVKSIVAAPPVTRATVRHRRVNRG